MSPFNPWVAPSLVTCIGHPVVIIGGAHLVRIAIFQGPTDADNEDRRILLQNLRFALLARQIGVHLENLLGMQED